MSYFKEVVIGNPVNNQITLLDDYTTTNVTYVGYATAGTATSAASWKIIKIDETNGLAITLADGDEEYNNIWDNRVTLSYS